MKIIMQTKIYWEGYNDGFEEGYSDGYSDAIDDYWDDHFYSLNTPATSTIELGGTLDGEVS